MSNNAKYCIIYHREDNDGLFSMAIIYNYLVYELKIQPANVNLIGADYEQMKKMSTEPVDDSGETMLDQILADYDNIIMTDISFADTKVMKEIYKKKGSKFIWIDHHAPVIAQANKDGLDKILGERSTKVSAILNAYRYFYDPFNIKYTEKSKDIEIFRILSAWDSFTYDREGYGLDYAMNVNTGVTNKFKLNPKKIIAFVHSQLYNGDFCFNVKSEFYETGSKINKLQDEQFEKMIAEYGAEWTVGENRTGVALFIQSQTSSMMFKSVKDKYQCGLVFKRLKSGNWTMSLYNTDTKYDKEFHCGNYIREHYNGGGHPGAAGCQLTETQFIKILKAKKI